MYGMASRGSSGTSIRKIIYINILRKALKLCHLPAIWLVSRSFERSESRRMLRQDINNALKEAMKAKDQLGVATLRLILAALKDRDIAARTKGSGESVGDPEIRELLQKMVRQRRDSIEMYEKGGRADLAEREAAEIEVISRFLPRPLSDAEVQTAITEVIAELEANSIKDMGRVMAVLKERYAGHMDFGRASAEVKRSLMGDG
jgi:uncharacterized protein YqeY